jgi:Flp pilus assembly pilin Flp
MQRILSEIKRFHKDDGGAPELSTVLLVALIAVPLILAILYFGQTAFGWFDSVIGTTEKTGPKQGSSTTLSGANSPGAPTASN